MEVWERIDALGEGRQITIELNPSRAREARENFHEAGVDGFVEDLIGDAAEVLMEITRTGGLGKSVDFLFLDNDFASYFRTFRAIEPRLADGALIVADNAGIGAGCHGGYGVQGALRHAGPTHRVRTALEGAASGQISPPMTVDQDVSRKT